MRILAIETSCDETAIAIIERIGNVQSRRFRILSNIVSSQVKIHAPFGGVVPNLAKREHQKNLVSILLTALKEAGLFKSKIKNQKSKIQSKNEKRLQAVHYMLQALLEREQDLFARIVEYVVPLQAPAIDAIAVTHGPGLEPALWVGVNFAKALAYIWKKPLIPINHMEGHIFSALLEKRGVDNFQLSNFQFPMMGLLVSGGHTELVLIKKLRNYRIIGETLDDAAGEAFDKVAKMLGLGYPGGPAISKLAEKGNEKAIQFPRPMIHAKNFDFSFSGLKTSVFYYLRDRREKKLTVKLKVDVAASFQQAVVDVLAAKMLRALRQYGIKTLIVGGGVAANNHLRKTLRAKTPHAVSFFLPDLSLTGDNALMIGIAAFFGKKKAPSFVRAEPHAKLGSAT